MAISSHDADKFRLKHAEELLALFEEARGCPARTTDELARWLDYRRSDARAAENGFAAKSSVNKFAKVVLGTATFPAFNPTVPGSPGVMRPSGSTASTRCTTCLN